MFRVDLKGDGMQRVQGVHADTALKACTGHLAQFALHSGLGHQIISIFVDVQEPVYTCVRVR